MQDWSRNSRRLAAAAAIVVIAASTVSAHRRDEYLQAARIGIDADRVQIELDLTPGIAIARLIGREIDRDGTGDVSIDEAAAYANVVLTALRLAVDGTPLKLQLTASRFPTTAAMRAGEGTIRLRIAASTPALGAGSHELVYRNGHRPDIGVYLANALVPTDGRVEVTAQARDVDQRELTIDYVLRTDPVTAASRWPIGLAMTVVVGAGFWWQVRRRGFRWSRRGPGAAALVFALLTAPFGPAIHGRQLAPAPACDAPPTFAGSLAPQRVLHVAADATADGDGSPARPFPTLEAAARAARPGTAIRLGPGRHRTNRFVAGLRGTAAAPIWVGGEPGATSRPVIEGGEQAVGFQRAAFLVVHDLEIRGQTQNGINLDDGNDVGDPDASHHVALLRLFVHDVGDTGNQDCVKLSGLSDVFIYDSQFERCGGNSGSGIDQVGVHRSVIARNTFSTLGGNAVQAKGGSTDIDVRQNRMHNAGLRAVNLGGSTGLEFFRPRLSPTAPNAEARRVRVFNNIITFTGTELTTPFAFVGCVDCLVAHNLVSGAPRWLVRILQESVSRPGATFEPASRGRVMNNVFAFSAGALGAAVNAGANTSPDSFVFASNHWLATDDPARSRPVLPVVERGGITGPPTGYAPWLVAFDARAKLAPDAPEAGAAVVLPEVPGTYAGTCRGPVRSIGPFER